MTLDYKALYIISAQYIKACRKQVRKTNILSRKRGITHSKIDEIPGNMNLICDTSLQSLIQNKRTELIHSRNDNKKYWSMLKNCNKVSYISKNPIPNTDW